jgi:hypothetical protein
MLILANSFFLFWMTWAMKTLNNLPWYRIVKPSWRFKEIVTMAIGSEMSGLPVSTYRLTLQKIQQSSPGGLQLND